jgi:hypothetical protein
MSIYYCAAVNPDSDVECDRPAGHRGKHAHHDLDGLPESPDEDTRMRWADPESTLVTAPSRIAA